MTNLELQLLGLKVLATKHNEILEDIAASAKQLTGENFSWGHTNDWIYDTEDKRSPKQILDLVSE